MTYYMFDFGDGTPPVGPMVTHEAPDHVYVMPGSYLVTAYAYTQDETFDSYQ